jgi:hypothetical protein
VKICLSDQVDGSDIRFIAETAAEAVHMLKPKAVRLENGMAPFTFQDVLTLHYLILSCRVEEEV